MSFRRENRAPVAVCEESLLDGFWCDAAAAFRSLPDAPALVFGATGPLKKTPPRTRRELSDEIHCDLQTL
jgi:hypothetical protein